MPKGSHWLILGALLTETLFAFSQPPQPNTTYTTDGWIVSFFFQQTPTPTLIGGGSSSGGFALTVPIHHQTPPNQDDHAWQTAVGTFEITTPGTEAISTINFEAKGLVAYGLYSLWWVTPNISITAEDSTRILVFRADENGVVSAKFAVPADADYTTLGVAAIYHDSATLIGDQWGKLGTDSYLHLASANVADLPIATSTG
jgi:hypothetical protein